MHLLSLSTAPPRSLLLWGMAAASWLAPAAAAATAAAQTQVGGVHTGINNVTGERPSRKNINDVYKEAGPHWDLYVQALDLFEREDMNDLMSYFQIAGIHGLPIQSWNGVDQVAGGSNNVGYCPHGQTTFITWHRPYLALYEQVLASHVQKVARQYPAETVAKYTAAANTFRIPYWDWAVDAHLPPAVTGETITYNGPAGPATMRNPLYSYRFPNFPFTGRGGFGGGLAKWNETKRCIQTTGAQAGITDANEGNTVLEGNAATLQDKVYAVFTQSTSFESMATMSNRGASFEEPHNIIHNDIACFSVSGRTGHMSNLNWSGFDPLFFLHHVNVDRLFAMWQAINYKDPVFTTEQTTHALFGTAAGNVTADSPLRPFAMTVNENGTATSFHTSRTIQNIVTFGYTYPEINDWSQDKDTLASSVKASVARLYGPSAHTSTVAARSHNDKRSSSSSSSPCSVSSTSSTDSSTGGTDSTGSGVLATFDYSVELSVDRSEIPRPSIIEMYLLDDADDLGSLSSNSTAHSVRIGSTSIMAMPTTGTSYSVTPLHRVLHALSANNIVSILFPDSSAVLNHIRDRLRIVIKTQDGSVVPLSGGVYPGILPAVPDDGVPVIPDKDRRTNAATAASAAGVRAISAQALQFYFRAPVKAFFRTRVDYLAYARGPDGDINAERVSSNQRLRNWLRRTTPGVLTLAIKRHGWSVVPEQVLPPLLANVGVAGVLYSSYLQILGWLHPESSQARRRVYPPPAPTETFVAGFLAGSFQSLVAAPLDAIQARYDHRAPGMGSAAPAHGSPQSMWSFSAAKLREIGLRGIFAGWSLSLVKDSFGNAIFFSVFEYIKAQGYYHFVAYYYGAMDGSMILAQQMRQQTAAQRYTQRRQWIEDKVNSAEAELEAKIDRTPEHHHHHHHDGRDSITNPPTTPRATADVSAPVVIRPHYALEPAFLLLAGVSASLSQQVLLHPLTHFQVVHWDLLEDLDAAAKADRAAAAARACSNGTAPRGSQGVRSLFRSTRFHFMQTYYNAYLRTWATCAELAASEGRSRGSWLYRGFWWNAIRQVPSTSAGLIIFELLRRKYGMAGEGVRISQDGYDILLT